jgi:hypothetical protein
MLPSFYIPADRARSWSVVRAAALGAGIGLVASLFRTFGPLHGSTGAGGVAASIPEIGAAVFGFAVLCAGASALRNLIARRLIWPDL